MIDTLGDDLDPFEGAMVDGMLSRGAHPHVIVNAIRSRREHGESARHNG